MKHTDIVTNKRTAAKAALLVFMLCTVIMFAMSIFSSWEPWVIGMLTVNAVVLTVMTFHPNIPVKAQSVVLMLFSFANIFTCSIMANDIYMSISVFIGAAILISVYKDVKLLLSYALLIVGGVFYHIFALGSVSFESMTDIIHFIVRISVMITALVFLLVFISSMNKNEEELTKSVAEARQAPRASRGLFHVPSRHGIA